MCEYRDLYGNEMIEQHLKEFLFTLGGVKGLNFDCLHVTKGSSDDVIAPSNYHP